MDLVLFCVDCVEFIFSLAGGLVHQAEPRVWLLFNVHKFFDTPTNAMWDLCHFPLNLGKSVSMSTNKIWWQ